MNKNTQSLTSLDNDSIPEPHELKNKPLVEAIFELRWKLQPVEPQSQQGSIIKFGLDPGFQVLVGQYYEQCKKTFPEIEDLPITDIPPELTGHSVRHRFRSGKGDWPVTQIGPGILTVNETEKYKWDTFKKLVMESIDNMYNIHTRSPLYPIRVELHYIDAIAFDIEDSNILEFLRKNLHIDIKVDESLIEEQLKSAQPAGFFFHVAYPLSKPKCTVITEFKIGHKNNKPSIIWDTILRSVKEDVPQKPEDINSWLDEAHEITDKVFFTLTRGDLQKAFEGKK